MDVKEAIGKRRAYRNLEPAELDEETVEELARAAQLAPSCFNNQPWNYVFIYEKEQLERMHDALSSGNAWAKKASLIIAVFSKQDDDCVVADRTYNLFDTGLGTSSMILRATEMGLVAHPIAGFSQKKTRNILGIPEEYQVIALVIVGKFAGLEGGDGENREHDSMRPERKGLDEFVHHNRYG